MRFVSTKTYGHEIGLSCCFRQWRAESHCNKLHGYALSFRFEFGAQILDGNNWVIDFGGLKELRAMLEERFDHKLVVAIDDPLREELLQLGKLRAADVVLLQHVGCEFFAKQGASLAQSWLVMHSHSWRVKLLSCEVREHGANSAVYYPELPSAEA